MFGSALHFDHKYPALVLGIFLSIKSFTTGSADISSHLMLIKTSASILG